jgi:hypothetical protein
MGMYKLALEAPFNISWILVVKLFEVQRRS